MGRVTGSEGHELGLLPCDPNSVCLQCRSRPPDSDIILCDHCESEWHMLCLRPPMACVPEGEWICPDCPGRKAGPENGQGDGHVNGQSEIPMTSSKGTSQRPVLGAQAKSPREEGTPGTPGASGAGPVAERGIKGHRVSSGSGLNRKRKAGLVPKSENADSAGAVVPLKDLGSFLACAICLETLEHPISTPCGHNSCRRCFLRWMRQGKEQCPRCRSPIPQRMLNLPRVNAALAAATQHPNIRGDSLRCASASGRAFASGGGGGSGTGSAEEDAADGAGPEWGAGDVKKLLRELACELCRGVLRAPVSTPCGHVFCQACLEGRFSGLEECRNRNVASCRALREHRVPRPCPAPDCTLDLNECLTYIQVNKDLQALIGALQQGRVRRGAKKQRQAAPGKGHGTLGGTPGSDAGCSGAGVGSSGAADIGNEQKPQGERGQGTGGVPAGKKPGPGEGKQDGDAKGQRGEKEEGEAEEEREGEGEKVEYGAGEDLDISQWSEAQKEMVKDLCMKSHAFSRAFIAEILGGNKKKSSGKAEMSGSPSLHPHSTPGVVQGQEPKQKVQAEEETPLLRDQPSGIPRRPTSPAPVVVAIPGVPELVRVSCNGVTALYLTQEHRVVCLCAKCGKGPQGEESEEASMAMTVFEAHCGSKRKNWSDSVFLADSCVKLRDWLTDVLAQGVTGLKFQGTLPKSKGPGQSVVEGSLGRKEDDPHGAQGTLQGKGGASQRSEGPLGGAGQAQEGVKRQQTGRAGPGSGDAVHETEVKGREGLTEGKDGEARSEGVKGEAEGAQVEAGAVQRGVGVGGAQKSAQGAQVKAQGAQRGAQEAQAGKRGAQGETEGVQRGTEGTKRLAQGAPPEGNETDRGARGARRETGEEQRVAHGAQAKAKETKSGTPGGQSGTEGAQTREAGVDRRLRSGAAAREEQRRQEAVEHLCQRFPNVEVSLIRTFLDDSGGSVDDTRFILETITDQPSAPDGTTAETTGARGSQEQIPRRRTQVATRPAVTTVKRERLDEGEPAGTPGSPAKAVLSKPPAAAALPLVPATPPKGANGSRILSGASPEGSPQAGLAAGLLALRRRFPTLEESTLKNILEALDGDHPKAEALIKMLVP